MRVRVPTFHVSVVVKMADETEYMMHNEVLHSEEDAMEAAHDLEKAVSEGEKDSKISATWFVLVDKKVSHKTYYRVKKWELKVGPKQEDEQ